MNSESQSLGLSTTNFQVIDPDKETETWDKHNIERNTIKLQKLFVRHRQNQSGFYNPSFFDKKFGADGLEKKVLAEPSKNLRSHKHSRTQVE